MNKYTSKFGSIGYNGPEKLKKSFSDDNKKPTNHDIVIGTFALKSNISGFSNAALGSKTLPMNTPGAENTALWGDILKSKKEN